MIYLDHNATTPPHREVINYISDLNYMPLNASSIHKCGRRARGIIEQARNEIYDLLNLNYKKFQLVFTSSGTEANNQLLASFIDADIFISSVEHISLYEFRNHLTNITLIKVNNNGLIDLIDLEEKLSQSKNSKKLISIILANNETGVIQDFDGISRIVRKYAGIIHSDITQAVGRIEIDVDRLDIDLITLSSHKFGGIMGAGALIAKINHPLRSLITGGGQEKYLRAGSENTAAIAAFGKAAALVKQEISTRMDIMSSLQYRLENNLPANIEIIAKNINRLPNTSLLIAEGFDASTLLIQFDLENICVSSGAACSSGKVKKSHVLLAMQVNEKLIESAIRVSLSHYNTINEIDRLTQVINKLYNK